MPLGWVGPCDFLLSDLAALACRPAAAPWPQHLGCVVPHSQCAPAAGVQCAGCVGLLPGAGSGGRARVMAAVCVCPPGPVCPPPPPGRAWAVAALTRSVRLLLGSIVPAVWGPLPGAGSAGRARVMAAVCVWLPGPVGPSPPLATLAVVVLTRSVRLLLGAIVPAVWGRCLGPGSPGGPV